MISNRLFNTGKSVVSDSGKKSLTRRLFLLNSCINVVLVIQMLSLMILFDVACLQKKPLYVVLIMVILTAIPSIALICLFYGRYVVSKKNEVKFKAIPENVESLASLLQRYKSCRNLFNATNYLEKKNKLESIKQEDLFTSNGVDNVNSLQVKIERGLQNLIKRCRDRIPQIYSELENMDMSRITELAVPNSSFFTKHDKILKGLLEAGKLISEKENEINILSKSYCERILPIIASVIESVKLYEPCSRENSIVSFFYKDRDKKEELKAALINAETMFQKLIKQEIGYPTFAVLYNIVWCIESFILYVQQKDMGVSRRRIQKFVKSVTSHSRNVANQENNGTLLEKNISEKDTTLVAQLFQLQDVMLRLCIVQLDKPCSVFTTPCIDYDIAGNVVTSDPAVQWLQNASVYDLITRTWL
ncbi:hypothetical protein [Ehrlichia muris]|uniref:Uncharacterized protein n=1 Tax=Ehrlichia cf. muris str. EmCRT TaxID=1359167 RepID=A0A0F3NDB2_9RICK|nr:hypothetical protein [Ehrlichia muris]KJV65692.1 hypothetical protein EMUCRT_0645 [Ehrlichia cf. muris str. EmCRT]